MTDNAQVALSEREHAALAEHDAAIADISAKHDVDMVRAQTRRENFTSHAAAKLARMMQKINEDRQRLLPASVPAKKKRANTKKG